MKPLEILSALPQWAKASADDLLASPAWAMPCRLGEQNCMMRLDGTCPSETLDLLVRFGNEEHVLGLRDCESLQELHAVWPTRAEVPEPILLALVEKDCGTLFQLLENAVRQQLGVIGLASSPRDPDAQTLFAQIYSADGAPLVAFSLSSSPSLVAALGQLRFLDAAHPAIRDCTLPAEVEFATFTLPAADLAALAPGDALLLPEIGTIPPRRIACNRFLVGENGVIDWKDDGALRVLAMEPVTMTVGDLLDLAASNAAPPASQPLPANTPLRLARFGKVLATGRLDAIGAQQAFIVDAGQALSSGSTSATR